MYRAVPFRRSSALHRSPECDWLCMYNTSILIAEISRHSNDSQAASIRQHGWLLQDHYDEVRQELVRAVSELKSGDPRQEDTFIGPLISLKEAERVESWVSDAVSKGTPICHGLGGPFYCACNVLVYKWCVMASECLKCVWEFKPMHVMSVPGSNPKPNLVTSWPVNVMPSPRPWRDVRRPVIILAMCRRKAPGRGHQAGAHHGGNPA